MAAIVAGATYGEETAATTNHDVVVPAGSVAGDLLVLQANRNGSGTITLAGWTRLMTEAMSSVLFSDVWFKILEGEQANFAWTNGFARLSSHRLFHITGAHASTAPEGSDFNGNAGSVNPPLLTLTNWGASEETLWLAMVAFDGNKTAAAYPTDFADNQFTQAPAVEPGLGVCSRSLAAASMDPSPFTASSADQWVTQTVGIRPAAAAGGGGGGGLVRTVSQSITSAVARSVNRQ